MNLKKIFLSAGLLLAIIGALVLPQFGIWLKKNSFVPVFVILIFLIGGWQFNLRDAELNRKFIQALLISLVISLLGGPFAGIGAVRLFGFGAMTALGLIVMTCGPVTLSSATVITGLSGGNSLWALFITIIMNIVGIFTIPVMLKFCLEEAEGVDISAGKLLFKLILLVLLPFLIGIFAKKLIKIKVPSYTSYITSTCVIMTVYAAAAASHKILYSSSIPEVFIIALASLMIHLALMLAAFGGGKLIKLAKPELKAMVFVSSQKTLPIAISVLAVISDNTGAAIIPCLVFHFTQLFTDSAIANLLAASDADPKKL